MSMNLKLIARIWLALFLVLAGAGLAQAQDNDSENAPGATTVQETAPSGAQPPAETVDPEVDAKAKAVVQASLPGGILEAASKAERTATAISEAVEEQKKKLATPSLPQTELAKSREELEAVRERAKVADAELSEPLAQLDQLVARFGPAPAEGASEPEAVAAQRKQLEDVRGKLLGARAQLALAAGAADQLASQAGQIERTRFRDFLLARDKSVFQPALWTQGVTAIPALVTRTRVLLTGFHTAIVTASGSFSPWFLLGAFIVLMSGGYKLCRILAHKVRSETVDPGELGKLLRVVAVPLGYAVVAIIATGIFYLLLISAAPDASRMHRLFGAFAIAMTGFAFARGVARSVLSPTRPDWRIANLSNDAAGAWLNLSTIGFMVIGLSYLIDELASIVNLTGDLLAMKQAGVTIILVVILVRLIFSSRSDRPDEEETPGATQYFAWASYTLQPVWLIIAVSILALMGGYLTFAGYLAGNVFVLGVSLSFLYCLRRMADAFVSQAISPKSRVSRTLKSAFSMTDRGIKRAGIAINAGVDVSLLLLGLPLVLAMSALTWVDIRSWISTAFFGFKVGDITISLSSIMLAFGVFGFGLLLTRYITSWLDRRILTPTDIDQGVRDSIRTGAGYLATILALLVAFAAAGVDFGNIAIVAGALSVGIGFGLQSIVNNFVSGLILLAERPIKIGDWVNVTAGEGTVKKINVRSTEIETFDRCSIIVPNSSLISENVQNWTHGDQTGRVKLMVGVSYSADPQQVHDILLKCAEEHPRSLAFPPATVLFKEFGASSLDFEVRVFIDDVYWVAFVASDLRYSIHKALKEAEIEIPFPQQDVYIKEVPKGLK